MKLEKSEIQEIEVKILYAMEYNLELELIVWDNEYEGMIKGKCHHLDYINKRVRIVEEWCRGIKFEGVIKVIEK